METEPREYTRRDLVVAFWASRPAGPVRGFIAVCRFVHLRLDDQMRISSRVLADNMHTSLGSLLEDLASPFAHVSCTWDGDDVDADTFSPCAWIRRATGDTRALAPLDLAELDAIDDRPTPQPAMFYGPPTPWDAAAFQRYLVQMLERVVVQGSTGGRRAILRAHTVGVNAPASWLSSHVAHGEVPMSSDRGGSYKWVIPTNWWGELDTIAARRRPV